MVKEGDSLLKNKTFLFSAVVIIALIAIVAYLVYKPSSSPSSESLTIGNSPVLGDENAPVTIYEFTDFSCPFCEAAEGSNQEVIDYLKSTYPDWEAPVPLIKEQYVKTGKVKIVFKYFPGHGAAGAAHAIGYAVAEQSNELFWKFSEEAFAQPDNLNDIAKMKALAVELGADKSKIESYIASNKFLTEMKEDSDMGTKNKVQGTPMFFINGKVVSGAQSFSAFKEIIDRELG